MDMLNEVSDEEFVPFLQSLCVETYKKSFEWMLGDSDYSGILLWLYNNLDKNNALNSREEYRYVELETKQSVLSSKDLQARVNGILQEYPGLPLPGDEDALEELKMSVSMERERLNMLEKQKVILDDLVKKNEIIKKELNCEITQLNGSITQAKAEEKTLAEECIHLSEEVDRVTESVVDIVTNTLDLYSDTGRNKETAQKFYIFGPCDAYRQSQALFRSHFDLYTAKKFSKRQTDSVIAENELRTALVADARNLEDRLLHAALAYKDAIVDLEGERAKLELACNYDSRTHPNEISIACMEARNTAELFEQEEMIVEEQVLNTAKHFVSTRTSLLTDTAIKQAYDFRQEIYTDLCSLHAWCTSVLSIDTLVYYAVRLELRSLIQSEQFAADLAQYLTEELAASRSRIESMQSITAEQELSYDKLQTNDYFLKALRTLLALPPTADATDVVIAAMELKSSIKELSDKIALGFEKKESGLNLIKKSYEPIIQYLYDGCTKQPNCWSQSVASLSHTLTHRLAGVDQQILDAGIKFTAVKNGDKQNLRKLWQWFLTDEGKFVNIIKDIQGKSYS